MKRLTTVSCLAVVLLVLLVCSAPTLEPRSIKIGFTVSQTGTFREPSAMIHMAYRVWEQDINQQGGLLGRPVRLVWHDDQSDPDLVRQLYERLIAIDKVDLVFSPYSSTLTLPASDVAERHRMVMLACAASAEVNWSRGYRYLFGVYPPASRYFISLLDVMARHGLSSVAIVYGQNPMNISAARGAGDWAVRFGMKVVLNRGYQDAAAEFPRLITEVRKQNPDGLILCAYPDDGFLLLELLKKADYRPKVLGISIAPSFPDFAVRAGDMAEGVFAPSKWEPVERLPFPGSAEFIRKFTAMSGKTPNYHAAAALAAAQLMARAVVSTGSLNQDKIRNAILETDTVTIIGRFKLDATGLQVGHNPLLVQWQKGNKEIVYPSSLGTAPPLIDLGRLP